MNQQRDEQSKNEKQPKRCINIGENNQNKGFQPC